MIKNKIAMLLVFTFLGTMTMQAQSKWAIDKAHSNIRFSATHYVITEVEGQFKDFDASVVSKTDDFKGAEVMFTAKVASIDTDNERRDGHLKSDDFFNADQFPEIKFQGKIESEGDKYFLVGDFTMRDVTKPMKFEVKYNGSVDLENGKKAGFKVMGVVDRFEYGIKFNKVLESGGLVVSQEIQITCNVELNEVKDS